MRQLSLFKPPSLEHGGEIRRGRRKLARPFDPKRALHVVLRSSRARGPWSLLAPKNKVQVHLLLESVSTRFGIRVYRSANAGNHLHLLLRAKSRQSLQGFLRTLAGLLARKITGAKKGQSRGKFWDLLAYSRVVAWGKAFREVRDYLVSNRIQSFIGIRPSKRVLIDSS